MTRRSRTGTQTHRNRRQLVVALLVFAVIALVSAAGFVSCGLGEPDELDDPTVRGPQPMEALLAPS